MALDLTYFIMSLIGLDFESQVHGLGFGREGYA